MEATSEWPEETWVCPDRLRGALDEWDRGWDRIKIGDLSSYYNSEVNDGPQSKNKSDADRERMEEQIK